MTTESRPIGPDERSGVLHPRNLERYSAAFHVPDPSISDVVDMFWTVEWDLAPGESIPQRIIADPAVTLSVESGDVPAELVVTGVHSRAWTRDIRGSGAVFAIRLRPAGLGVLTDLRPSDVADSTRAMTEAFDRRGHQFLAPISAESTTRERIDRATSMIVGLLAERPPTRHDRVANDAVAALQRGGELPTGVSIRTVQRALAGTIGHGPSWVRRWVRLQEVARSLAAQGEGGMAEIAARLGYVDQSHLVNDFRSAVGMTPGHYVRSLRGGR